MPSRRRPSVASPGTRVGPASSRRSDRTQHWYCYTLESATPGNSRRRRTYVGKTNCLQRRVDQHNGVRRGGARSTHAHRPWYIAFYVKGFANETEALQFEWRMHNPPRDSVVAAAIGAGRTRQRGGLLGRVHSLVGVCSLERWTRSSPLASERPITVVWRPELAALLARYRSRFPSHVRHEIATDSARGLHQQ